jgi:hypothetical protein
MLASMLGAKSIAGAIEFHDERLIARPQPRNDIRRKNAALTGHSQSGERYDNLFQFGAGNRGP